MITNPIFKGFNPDPCICRKGYDYYCAVSSFEWMPGIPVYHSKDLVHWELLTHVLTEQVNLQRLPSAKGIWAPCLTYCEPEDKFYVVYGVMNSMNARYFDVDNYVISASDICGPWSKPVYLHSAGFDASMLHDDDGRKYVVSLEWETRAGYEKPGVICLCEYDPQAKAIVGYPKRVWRGATNRGCIEAPHLTKRNGYYYLMCAEGGTDYHHSETIARSRDIWGPYEADPQTPFLSAYYDPTNPLQKCGHASLVETQNGEWYLAHLTGRPLELGRRPLFDLNLYGCCPLGRETALQKIEWVDGWPRVVGGRQGALEIEGPNLPEVPVKPTWPELGKDDFDSSELNINYQWLRIPLTEQMATLKERPGYLRLYGYESLASYHTQSLVARRWESFNFDAETAVEFEPDTFQQLAGLTCFYNRDNFTFIFVTWDEEKGRCIDLIGRSIKNYYAPIKNKVIPIPADVKKVYFKVEVRHDTYHYLYSFDGQNYTAIDYDFRSADLSDDHVERNGGRAFFTGAFVGMTCIDMQGTHKPADFDFFSYKNV